LSMSGKYNPNTTHTYKPDWVYDIAEFRSEVRKYYRTEYRGNLQNDTVKHSMLEQIERAFSRKRSRPRTWRAYYWGVYASTGSYSLKFAEEGKKGRYIGAGVSFGYGIPLYGYTNGNIDLEIGGSLGMTYTKYDAFYYSRENNCYQTVANHSKDWHLVPYPMITDLRVAFVYRFTSIKNKYKRINIERIERLDLKRNEIRRENDSIQSIRDSLSMEKKLEKEGRIKAKKALKEKQQSKINAMESTTAIDKKTEQRKQKEQNIEEKKELIRQRKKEAKNQSEEREGER
ncbi:MAG: DUF3575 domain-containing protein, partial [Phocaeicola sp.]